MKFTAVYVEPSIGSAVANALFADPESNPDKPSVLMLSRAIDIPDSAYYFEINDQSNSSYGGLESVKLSRNSLTVKLSPETVEEFGNEDFAEIEANFDIDDELYAEVLNAVKKIFEDENILTIG